MDHPEIPYNFSQPFAYMFSEQKWIMISHPDLPVWVPNGSQRASIHHPLGFNWHRLEGAGKVSSISAFTGSRCFFGGTCLWSQSRSTLLAVRIGLSRGKGLRVRGNWAPTIQL